MRARIEMELEDVPGQLVKALDPISRHGANIQNVVHKREEKTPLGKVPVTVIFEVKGEESLEKIIEEIESLGARITRVGEREAAARMVLIVVGDVVGTDLKDSIERLNSISGARISDLSLAVGEKDDESSARVIIEASGQEELETAASRLREIAEEKDLLLIEPLE